VNERGHYDRELGLNERGLTGTGILALVAAALVWTPLVVNHLRERATRRDFPSAKARFR
jgi:hypothetical protein